MATKAHDLESSISDHDMSNSIEGQREEKKHVHKNEEFENVDIKDSMAIEATLTKVSLTDNSKGNRDINKCRSEVVFSWV